MNSTKDARQSSTTSLPARNRPLSRVKNRSAVRHSRAPRAARRCNPLISLSCLARGVADASRTGAEARHKLGRETN